MDLRDSVIERYRVELEPEMDRAQFEEFVTKEVDRLEAVAAHLHPNQRAVLQELWSKENPEAQMTFAQRTELEHQARRASIEVALHHLWEGHNLASDEDRDEEQILPSATSSAMDRWLTPDAEPATLEMQRLAEHVWPNQGSAFQVWGEELLQARAEDGLRLPSGPQDQPLMDELTSMVQRALDDQRQRDEARTAERR